MVKNRNRFIIYLS